MPNIKYLAKNLESIPVTNDVGDQTHHILTPDMIDAVNAALAINRPLLVWGEPGIGKSQLAKAVARKLNRHFLPFVADAHTESRDLLWSVDFVARLAEAQIQGPGQHNREALNIQHFVRPGVLWWALNRGSAEGLKNSTAADKDNDHQQAKENQSVNDTGSVVLIDEIDKADSSVPNGLLEVLGASRFHPLGLDEAVESVGTRPLVMITTNQERTLPDAFIRRCLALHLKFPENAEQQHDFLVSRAEINFSLDKATVLLPAAKMLVADRQHAKDHNLFPLPGQAEYFDLLRGIKNQQQHGTNIKALMETLRRFTYQKHPDFPRESFSKTA